MSDLAPPPAPSDAPSPEIAAFMAHWESLRPAPDLLPGRQHFDPMRIPRLLPHIWMVDVLPGPPRRYRVRLVGGALVEAGFFARPGDFADDPRLSPNPADVAASLDRIVETGRGEWRRGQSLIAHTKYIDSIERAAMPLAQDGRTVDIIICMSIVHWRRDKPAGGPASPKHAI